jgi:hypothetical protein
MILVIPPREYTECSALLAIRTHSLFRIRERYPSVTMLVTVVTAQVDFPLAKNPERRLIEAARQGCLQHPYRNEVEGTCRGTRTFQKPRPGEGGYRSDDNR